MAFGDQGEDRAAELEGADLHAQRFGVCGGDVGERCLVVQHFADRRQIEA
jgi:hypothetical protein